MTSEELDQRIVRIESGIARIESSIVSLLNAVTAPPAMHDTRTLAMQIASGDMTALRNRNKIAKKMYLSGQEN